MDNYRSTVDLIKSDEFRMHCLVAARSVGLPDWLVVAGFVRNLIWDRLHDYVTPTLLSDVDVVFFDSADISQDRERHVEARLAEIAPGIQWQVRNQARMHHRNGHSPYRNTADAISYYPEVETCIGSWISDDGVVHVVAPYGIDLHWEGRVRQNPKSGYAPELMESRIRDKHWLQIWPALLLAVPVRD